MTASTEIRQQFLKFFQSKGHEVVSSSSLVPGNDPTLLFTNAGMVQFKDVFIGRDKRSYSRATSSQRCVRAGGKHNDLENVGYTARHHTFFEMLGNFSFGDYFKEDAITYAWEFLTEVVKLPKEKLWITVYENDDDAADIWLNKIKVDKSRFSKIGDKSGGKKYESDNFWAMGDTGPCGPCTEIFYDHGEDIFGGPPGTPDEEGDRYIEIWNLVFMQYNRTADGVLNDLPAPSVDTGMGLERLAAILQGVHNNYDIDLFQHLIKAAAKATKTTDLESKSLRVIADHIRSCAFLIVDGVLPSNEGRGYVLRRIIRRAARHGHQLGMDGLFFHKLVNPLVEQMGEAYPELADAKENVERTLKQEEKRFAETLSRGMEILKSELSDELRFARYATNQATGSVFFQDAAPGKGVASSSFVLRKGGHTYRDQWLLLIKQKNIDLSEVKLNELLKLNKELPEDVSESIHVVVLVNNTDDTKSVVKSLGDVTKVDCKVLNQADLMLSGEVAFKLYDTYGFPVDLTADIAREQGLNIDHDGFEKAMEAQRDRGRAAGNFGVDYNKDLKVNETTTFTGYDKTSHASKVKEIFVEVDNVEHISEGQHAVIVLDKTPFYGESGGQVGDTGSLDLKDAKFIVTDTQKQGDSVLHIGYVSAGKISKGGKVKSVIDVPRRNSIKSNHSATHLMHAALRKTLGTHVQQKGSLVDDERLRFDFSHMQPVTKKELQQIEKLVNEQVCINSSTKAKEMSLVDAKASGAMALFGEKYADVVRVVSMGEELDQNFSTELCGGVHVDRVGDIGFFKIIAESGIASGVRRIEAITGSSAVRWVEEKENQLDNIAGLLKSSRDEVTTKVEQLIARLKEQDKELNQLKAKQASQAGSDLSSQAELINGVNILAVKLDGADSKTLRDTMDQLKNKLGSAAILLASENAGKVLLVAGVTKDKTSMIKAGDLVKIAAAEVGGKGGGRPDMAQAGGDNPNNIPKALQAAKTWLQQKLQA